MDYYGLIKQALEYEVGDLTKPDGMIDVYRHDKFLFQFPPSYKGKLTIYLYDDRYDIYTDYNNAVLKVYENEQWDIQGVWERGLEDYLDDLEVYLNNLNSYIIDNTEELEQKKSIRLAKEHKEEKLQIVRFRILFGEIAEEYVFENHSFLESELVSKDILFNENNYFGRLFSETFDAQRIFRFPEEDVVI